MKIKHVGKMTVAAHRGDCYNYYENTMTAFKKALEEGAHMIETDVRLTKDGVMVLMHDAAVDRTTDGTGAIADMTYDEIKALNAGDVDNPEQVPQFEEFIKWAAENNVMVNVEFKEYSNDGNKERCIKCIEDVISVVDKYLEPDSFVLNCFDAFILEYIYKKYGKKYLLHGFYPYTAMHNVSMNPDEYLYCACIWGEDGYRYLAEKNIEAWIGAGVTQESALNIAHRLGARLITTNNPADVLAKLERIGDK